MQGVYPQLILGILNISILLYKFDHYELNIEIIIQQIPSILYSFMRYGVR